ncbi:MAG: SAM-dependent chlorinase/fluorinase [Bacteroidales bacterium]
MPLITLTSDWGTRDHYLASVKGKILSLMPEANIVDISHDIPPFSLKEAAFVFRNSYTFFPKDTVHILGIETEESGEHPHIAVLKDGHYFIGSDNGIFCLIFDDPPEKIIELTIPQDTDYFTFSTRDRFIRAAVHLAGNDPIEALGTGREELTQMIHFEPVVDQDTIKGMVIYVDNYENAITNISRELFDRIRNGRKYRIVFRGEEIKSLSDSYADVNVSYIVALFGSNGLMEIAINKGNASGLVGLYVDAPIRVEFY